MSHPTTGVITATIGDDTIDLDGTPLDYPPDSDPRAAVIHAVVEHHARPLGQPVRVVATDPAGQTTLTVHPDGTITDVATDTPAPTAEPDLERLYAAEAVPEPPTTATSGPSTRPAPPQPSPGPGTGPGTGPGPAAQTGRPSPDAPPPPTLSSPTSVQQAHRPGDRLTDHTDAVKTPPAAEPPRTFLRPEPAKPFRGGWRGALARIGIKTEPSPAEKQHAADLAAVSQHWYGPRTIVVANGKGGSAKTPTVIGLAAVFARLGGGSVCAWSNHQMRGTLLWHLVESPHAATTQDLLAAAPGLLEAAGQVGDLARWMHHQPADRFDVLQADPTKTSDKQRFDHRAVNTVHDILSRYYRLVIIDTDNDESAPHWRQAIERADQLVVATTTDDVRAETGRLMLDDLHGRSPHARRLADSAVVVVSQAHHDEPPAAGVADRFRAYGVPAATIPYDPAMKRLTIAYDALHPATQRAYLTAAALVANALPTGP